MPRKQQGEALAGEKEQTTRKQVRQVGKHDLDWPGGAFGSRSESIGERKEISDATVAVRIQPRRVMGAQGSREEADRNMFEAAGF